MKKASYVVTALFLGWTIAALGSGCASSPPPPADDPPAAEESIRVDTTSVQASDLEASPQPNACVANSCLGSRTCSACCAGHSCVTRTGCPQFGLACN